MENCLAAAVLNGVDRRSLQRSARLGLEVLERAKRRAVDWPAQERPEGSAGRSSRGPAPGPHGLLPGEREERQPTLSTSFRTMAEFMDYASSQCGKYSSSKPEEGGATHVFRYHRGTSEIQLCTDLHHGQIKDREKPPLHAEGIHQTSELASEASHLVNAARECAGLSHRCHPVTQAEDVSKDLYIEVYPGIYSVTVGSSALTKMTHVVAVDSGQSVDLVFPV
ncbi:A-kinase-interacting protein 1 isoform X1 [Perognathus longimembris pacificus]|uniref:A-kinase-interacting protein 1 isoform X1 n=1 Tax=Perognathus longimembris pacificus TaxID=214514 RepID=UPI002019AC04|nr:A-kinase-interacting protein 1 isoform X1 [Perognathus longimembris pacificus]